MKEKETGITEPAGKPEEKQLEFLPINQNTSNLVVQANSMILGRQDLALNEAKLVRIAIMQIEEGDTRIKPYVIRIGELAKMLDLPDGNISRDIRKICSGIMGKFLEIQSADGSWEQYHWASTCKYNARTKLVEIQLDNSLAPFLIGLNSYLTKYELTNTLAMRSTYAIRLYELIMQEIYGKSIPKEGLTVYLELETIRETCNLNVRDHSGKIANRKLEKISQFKEKVLKIALREIENVSTYVISYTDVKKGRSIIGFNFLVRHRYKQ